MSVGISFTLLSMFYNVMLYIVYCSKVRLNSVENKLYKALILITTLGSIEGVFCYYGVVNHLTMPIFAEIVSKGYLVFLLCWFSTFTLYVLYVSNAEAYIKFKEKYEKAKKVVLFLGMIVFFLIWFLPINYVVLNNGAYTSGPSVLGVYTISTLYFGIWIICMLKNIHNLNRKFFPIFANVILLATVIIIQKMNPALLLVTSSLSFVTFLMYFTIENPDIKMIEELNKAKNLSEKYNNDKSIFLFNFTQQIKPLLNEIEQLSVLNKNTEDEKHLKNRLLNINEQANRILSTINNIFDTSTIDSSKIKVIENEYNLNLLLNEIILKNKKNIEDKKLEFRVNLDEGLPEALYGDYIKLKQVLNSLLLSSLKNTDRGFIELNVTSIIKYDVCRLIINIEDSGIGVEFGETDEEIKNNKSEDPQDIDSFDNEISLKVIRKIVNLIGGTIMIKSSKKEGTKYTLVIDQLIVQTRKNKTIEDFERYKKIQLDKINVMVVDDEQKKLESLAKKLSSDRVNIVTVNGGQLCLEKIRNKEKYDLILIDDVLNKLSTEDTEKKLKQIKDFNTPVIVISDNDDPVTKSMYLQTGFNGIITKPIKKKEFEKLIDEIASKKEQ